MIKCEKCLLNEIDHPEIKLDDNLECDICKINKIRIFNVEEKKKSQSIGTLINNLKSKKKSKYDCLIGISGGTDSSYLVYLAKKWELNPLLLHVDGGWNSEISVINIERIVENSGFDFVTEVLPWHEMRELQKAFIKSNTIDIDLPFDNAMLKYNYLTAEKYNIKHILNGYSTTTEGIMPPRFAHYKNDKRNIKDIYKKHSNYKLKELKLIGTFGHIYYDKIKKIKFLYPLDLINYNKKNAREIIEKEFNWRDYGGKHYENVFTRFYQGYILPNKFNIDKRKSHFSMLICSNQITKKDAEEEIEKNPPYSSGLLKRDDKIFFCKKLKISLKEFDSYIKSPEVSHRKFKSDLDYYDFFKPLYKFLKKWLKFKIFRI